MSKDPLAYTREIMAAMASGAKLTQRPNWTNPRLYVADEDARNVPRRCVSLWLAKGLIVEVKDEIGRHYELT